MKRESPESRRTLIGPEGRVVRGRFYVLFVIIADLRLTRSLSCVNYVLSSRTCPREKCFLATALLGRKNEQYDLPSKTEGLFTNKRPPVSPRCTVSKDECLTLDVRRPSQEVLLRHDSCVQGRWCLLVLRTGTGTTVSLINPRVP